KRREIIEEAKTEAKKILDGSNAAIERTIAEIKTANAERERTLEARRKLKEERLQLEHAKAADNDILRKAPKKRKQRANADNPGTVPQAIEVGTRVRLDGNGTVGTVMELQGKNAVVAFGNLKTTVKTDRLKATNAQLPETKKASVSMATIDSGYQQRLNFKQEIDVRGMRADEAVQAVTYYIDDAVRFSASRVRILHGTGTGALRQAIREYLRTVPDVASAHDEDVRFGGAGITVVNLR
ncbi:MAG: Smr/MutS family protein, partial [Duncaniella sp.]|nr:Smr/MutS family protein [Duncaniella sp.]